MTPSFPLMLPAFVQQSSSQSPTGMTPTDGVSPLDSVKKAVEDLNPSGALKKAGNAAASSVSGIFGLSGWFGVRGVTMMLGLLLIAAGLFSHPAVREKIVSAGKVAGKAAALAA